VAKSKSSSKKTSHIQIKSWIETFEFGREFKEKNSLKGFVYFLGTSSIDRFKDLVRDHALSWQAASLKQNEREFVYFVGQRGPVWILRPRAKNSMGHQGLLDESAFAWCRDQFGSLVSQFKAHQLKLVHIELLGSDERQDLGALAGLEIASYNFRHFIEHKQLADLPKISIIKGKQGLSKGTIAEAKIRGRAVNLARHLVNLPPNELNPRTYADFIKSFKFPNSLKVSIWDAKKLEQEKMGLHLAVGQGSENGPCLIHLKYRPKNKVLLKPIAFVGKGITFDTGGLDLKPSSAMRLMKKDMGGAAGVTGLALWVAESQYPGPVDFYLALAENAVDGQSFRPSDVITARNGMKIEIDNTDAEGRLVLADALDVATSANGADEPDVVIDVATLTGAIKVGLGSEVAGLFSNDDDLANKLSQAGQFAGDLNWRMPLFDRYFAEMSSPFADFKNSGGSFGGAITAALFLQKFVRAKKWAHLDIYSWTDKAQGAFLASGGNGQPVQCLIEFLSHRSH
jgi:leucyl aminopeptidase